MKKPVTKEEQDDWEKVKRGKADKVKDASPTLTTQRSGLIQIVHGWHGNNYVWHISPAHPKRPWRTKLDRVIYAIAKVMNTGVIKPTTVVNVYPPYQEWDIPEITFKAMDLKSDWATDKKEIDKTNLKLFEVLNSLV